MVGGLWCRSCPTRKPDEMAKKATVSRDGSCVKEWLISCLPIGPLLTFESLGRVDFQWVLGVGWCGMGCVSDSPLTSGVVFLVVNPCFLRLEGAGGFGLLIRLHGVVIAVGMVKRTGEIVAYLH